MRLSYKVIKNTNITEQKCVIPTQNSIAEDENPSSDDMLKLIENANNMSQKIIESAERERDSIVMQAQFDAENQMAEHIEELKQKGFEEGKALGYEHGRSEGYEQGYLMGQESIHLLELQVNDVLKSAHSEAKTHIESMEVDIIELAINISERIIRTSLLSDHEQIYRSAKDVIATFKNRKQVVIRIHPQNVDLFNHRIDELKEVCEGAVFNMINDERVDITGCIIENENQIINTDITSQLENVKQALLKVRLNDGQQ